jgi:hypothetical protein
MNSELFHYGMFSISRIFLNICFRINICYYLSTALYIISDLWYKLMKLIKEFVNNGGEPHKRIISQVQQTRADLYYEIGCHVHIKFITLIY